MKYLGVVVVVLASLVAWPAGAVIIDATNAGATWLAAPGSTIPVNVYAAAESGDPDIAGADLELNITGPGPALTFPVAFDMTSTGKIMGGSAMNLPAGVGTSHTYSGAVLNAGYTPPTGFLATVQVAVPANAVPGTVYTIDFDQRNLGGGTDMLYGEMMDSYYEAGRLHFAATPVTVTITPEPSTWVMLLTVAGALAWWRRRRA